MYVDDTHKILRDVLKLGNDRYDARLQLVESPFWHDLRAEDIRQGRQSVFLLRFRIHVHIEEQSNNQQPVYLNLNSVSDVTFRLTRSNTLIVRL